ncbi:MAG: tyrosine-type recombinase/integrase [Labrys sp. (in: a-proteobacteria)]
MPLKLVQRPGSPNFHLVGTVRGIRIRESTGTADRRKAEEIRARRENEILDQSIHGRAVTVTFASAVVSYVTGGGEKRNLEKLVRELGNRRLAEIDQELIDATARKLYPSCKPSSHARRVYTPISAVLRHAASYGWCAERTFRRPEPSPVKTRWLRPAEAQRLIEACSPHMAKLVLFLLYTGARVSEAVYLDWANVDLSRQHAVFVDTKNGEERGAPLHPAIVSILANLPHRDGAVFRRPDGEPYERRAGDHTGGQIKTAFNAAVRRAKLPGGVTPHTLRHTWATWEYAAHKDIYRLMRLGGWKTESMVRRYVKIDATDFAAGVNDLPALKLAQNPHKTVA